MAASQQHGFLFERRVLDCVDRRLGPAGRAPAGMQAEHTARFDLPAWRDPTGAGVPTSIKIARRGPGGSVRVDLADARRTVALAAVPRLRLLVGIYEQRGVLKVVDEIREYLITGEAWAEASGDVPEAMIHRFHEQIKHPNASQARAIARQWKAKLAQYYPGIVRWAPKIDSKNQRRLQCSVHLEDLDLLVQQLPDVSCCTYSAGQGGLWGDVSEALPWVFESAPRQRHAKPSPFPDVMDSGMMEA